MRLSAMTREADKLDTNEESSRISLNQTSISIRKMATEDNDGDYLGFVGWAVFFYMGFQVSGGFLWGECSKERTHLGEERRSVAPFA